MKDEDKKKEQLYHTARLASIGELTAGTAHELNNLLTRILGFSELLLKADVPDEVKKDLEAIHTAAERAAAVVTRLLTFARRQEPHKESVNLNDLVKHMLDMRSYELRTSNIELISELDPALPATTIDPQQLELVFLTIIVNAEHAMTEAHGGGTLRVKTETLGNRIRVSFADDGAGIARENLPRIFDPFFTTREIGKGTGLDLSICHRIVTGHHGRIWAESEEGKGATFFVELPVLASEG